MRNDQALRAPTNERIAAIEELDLDPMLNPGSLIMSQKSLSLTMSVLLTGFLLFGSLACGQSSTQTSTSSSGSTSSFVECPVSSDQPDTFALCATASCWTLDEVAYCKCDIMNEESVSLTFEYEENGESKNVCNLLLDGINNGFTVSTYATPRQAETDYDPSTEKLGPPKAFYTCDKSFSSQAAYGAQCDGAICFKSTQGQDFPGLGHIEEDEIVCSCPPTTSSPPGFQIAGPWLCEPGDSNQDNQCCNQKFYDDMCSVTSISQTGTRLAVSAGIGDATAFSTKLDGETPSFNLCQFDSSSSN